VEKIRSELNRCRTRTWRSKLCEQLLNDQIRTRERVNIVQSVACSTQFIMVQMIAANDAALLFLRRATPTAKRSRVQMGMCSERPG